MIRPILNWFKKAAAAAEIGKPKKEIKNEKKKF